jgi:hypothetical protein
MSIEDYDYIDENAAQGESVSCVVFVKDMGDEIDNRHVYHFYVSNSPETVFAEGWGEIPACNVPRNLIYPDSDMFQNVVEVKTNIQLDLAQDNCCFSMQDARDHIVALAYENIDQAEVYPEPRIIIHYGEPIEDVEAMFAKRDVPMSYIE